MRGRIQGAHKMRQLLISVQEQLYASQTRFFWLELEAPFYPLDGRSGTATLFGSDCVVGYGRQFGGFVGDFGGDFVGGYTIASWPSFFSSALV